MKELIEEEIDITFPKPPSVKTKPVFLQNDMLQSVRVEAKFTDMGLEITIYGRHEKGHGELLGPSERLKLEEAE